jgi:uncharacterized DUF497 family protein
MDFEWDAAKDAENRRKHGLPLAAAARLDWSLAVRNEDRRRDYGEQRWTAIAPLAGRLHVCAYTLRKDHVRIISLRKANERERRRYGHRTASPDD